jgi:glycosyltransferase involved in cell wall biosynthesis
MEVAILDLFGGSGGVGRCTLEILQALAADGVSIRLCGRSHVVDSIKGRLSALENIGFNNLEQPKWSFGVICLKLAVKFGNGSSLLTNMLLRRSFKVIKRNGSISQLLVNYPQAIPPPSRHYNFAVFLHDLNWRVYPGNFLNAELTDRNCRKWVERASKVITNSECTRHEVIEHYQCPPEKVVAAPLAPFRASIGGDLDSSKYLSGIGLVAGRFYLFPGVWGLHKGHETLTEAIERSQSTDPVVVTCGKPSDGIKKSTRAVATMRASLASRWEHLIAKKKLVVVSGVSDLEMQTLRTGCRAYVLPSQYEGFGFPLVETIYHHRPAIVSAIKAHKEILNRYPQYTLATLFPPASSDALAAALDGFTAKPGHTPVNWEENIEATWSWKNTVQKILSGLGHEANSSNEQFALT